mmetsp:Transcript_42200/g.108743  ORF Transcript_42200/g.108743 Transcript_42200/m.108743 type:complete len:317 (-) Transcript_42200:1017-1967(-)
MLGNSGLVESQPIAQEGAQAHVHGVVADSLLDLAVDPFLVGLASGGGTPDVQIHHPVLQLLDVGQVVRPHEGRNAPLACLLELECAPRALGHLQLLVQRDHELWGVAQGFREGAAEQVVRVQQLADVRVLVQREGAYPDDLLGPQRHLEGAYELVKPFLPRVRDEGCDLQSLRVLHERVAAASRLRARLYLPPDHRVHVRGQALHLAAHGGIAERHEGHTSMVAIWAHALQADMQGSAVDEHEVVALAIGVQIGRIAFIEDLIPELQQLAQSDTPALRLQTFDQGHLRRRLCGGQRGGGEQALQRRRQALVRAHQR